MLAPVRCLGWLLAMMALGSACENVGGPSGEGTRPSEPAPSAVPIGGCQKLCGRQSACLKTLHDLGAEGIFVEKPAGPKGCARACDRTARDPLLGKLLSRVIEQCTARSECDSFFGCALRQRLSTLAKNPWMRQAIQVRQRARAVRTERRAGRLDKAFRLCASLTPKTANSPSGEPAAAAVRKELVGACTQTIRAWVDQLASRLEKAVGALTPDAHDADCRTLRRWKAPAWLSTRDRARRRAARARELCKSLDTQRQLAYAVRDARRDAGQVEAALRSGRSGDTLYYKCIHKGSTLATLGKAKHPAAKKVAGVLRDVCCERFPAAFLKRHKRTGQGFDSRHCYKVKQVVALMSRCARPRVLTANRPLLAWAKERCP